MKFKGITDPAYFYENKEGLEHGMVFEASEDRIVMLMRSVPGDATDWEVMNLEDGAHADDPTKWGDWGDTIHPTDLRKQLG